MAAKSRNVTQREIARIAGVSQSTVSTVLNGREDTTARIPEATRARVRQVIEELRYVADPAARRLAGLDNQIVGVFTYEPALSPESLEFYGPLLNGVEAAAEQAGCDLLFFTGTPVEAGKRRIFNAATRYRLTDGMILLGRQMDGGELERLLNESFPFVAVGRRDETDARVPFVGVDYAPSIRALVGRAYALGHRSLVYVHLAAPSPGARDRFAALAELAAELGVKIEFVAVADMELALNQVDAGVATCVFTEDEVVAQDVAHAFARRGRPIADLSLAALAGVDRHRVDGVQLTGMRVPRARLAREAFALLEELIRTPAEEWSTVEVQRTIEADVELGDTIRVVVP